MVWSMGVPSFAERRYFLSQMSREASWKGMLRASLGSIFTAVLIAATRLPMQAAAGFRWWFSPCAAAPSALSGGARLTQADPAVSNGRSVHPPGATLRTQHLGSGG